MSGKRLIKPRLRRAPSGAWECTGGDWTCWGRNPQAAYIAWRLAMKTTAVVAPSQAPPSTVPLAEVGAAGGGGHIGPSFPSASLWPWTWFKAKP